MNILHHIDTTPATWNRMKGTLPSHGCQSRVIGPVTDVALLSEEGIASPRVYKETVVIDDGVILVGVLTGETGAEPHRNPAG